MVRKINKIKIIKKYINDKRSALKKTKIPQIKKINNCKKNLYLKFSKNKRPITSGNVLETKLPITRCSPKKLDILSSIIG